jgi:hypothetical protein
MQLTKLSAAPVLQTEVPPCAPAGEMNGGTASQLIRSVRRTAGAGRTNVRRRRVGPPFVASSARAVHTVVKLGPEARGAGEALPAIDPEAVRTFSAQVVSQLERPAGATELSLRCSAPGGRWRRAARTSTTPGALLGPATERRRGTPTPQFGRSVAMRWRVQTPAGVHASKDGAVNRRMQRSSGRHRCWLRSRLCAGKRTDRAPRATDPHWRTWRNVARGTT